MSPAPTDQLSGPTRSQVKRKRGDNGGDNDDIDTSATSDSQTAGGSTTRPRTRETRSTPVQAPSDETTDAAQMRDTWSSTMENAANAHPPVDIYKVKIGDVILPDTHDRAAVEEVLEAAITKWLRQLFPKENGKPSGKMKKTLLADLKKRQGSDRDIPLCQGQKVHARWTTTTGTLDMAVNAQNPLGAVVGFAGAIIRKARDAGYWAVRFDVDGKVHNFIPRKYIIPKNEPAVVSSE